MVVDDFVKFGLKLRLKSAQTLNKAFAEIVSLGRQNCLKPMMEKNVNKTSKSLLKLRQLKFDSKENYKNQFLLKDFPESSDMFFNSLVLMEEMLTGQKFYSILRTNSTKQ